MILIIDANGLAFTHFTKWSTPTIKNLRWLQANEKDPWRSIPHWANNHMQSIGLKGIAGRRGIKANSEHLWYL